MKSKKIRRASVVAGVALLVSFPMAANAIGYKYMTTSPGLGGYATAAKSDEGCTGRGVGNSASNYASTFWTDDEGNAGITCAAVGARAYYYAGGQSGWTAWDYDSTNAYVPHTSILTGQHLIFTEYG